MFLYKNLFLNIFCYFNPNHAYWNQRRLFSGNLPGMLFSFLSIPIELWESTAAIFRQSAGYVFDFYRDTFATLVDFTVIEEIHLIVTRLVTAILLCSDPARRVIQGFITTYGLASRYCLRMCETVRRCEADGYSVFRIGLATFFVHCGHPIFFNSRTAIAGAIIGLLLVFFYFVVMIFVTTI